MSLEDGESASGDSPTHAAASFEERFLAVIPRLAKAQQIASAIREHFGTEGPAILEAVRSRARLDDKIADEVCDVVRETFDSAARDVLSLGWDSNFPGGSGAIWISECEGVYVVTSSDYAPQGPFDSLGDALTECECFSTATSRPEISSEVLPLDELIGIASGVVDWENEGSIWINNVEYVVDGEELRPKESGT